MTDKTPTTDDGRIYDVLTQLTESIKALAHGRPEPQERDATARLHQRVDFGYRSLGALLGRTSEFGADFEVATFAAKRDGDVITLTGLPAAVEHLTLHASSETVAGKEEPERTETVAVQRHDDSGQAGGPRIKPVHIGANRSIDSMVGLAGEDGPLLAFGPRLPAATTAPTR